MNATASHTDADELVPGRLSLTGFAVMSRLTLCTDIGQLVLECSGHRASRPEIPHFRIITVQLGTTKVLCVGQIVVIRGPIYARRYSPILMVVKDCRLAISGDHFRTHLPPIRQAFIDYDQAF